MIFKPRWLWVRHSQFCLQRLQAMGFFVSERSPKREDWVDVLWNNIITSWHLGVKCSTTYLPFTKFDWFCLKGCEGKLLSNLPTLVMLVGTVEGVKQEGEYSDNEKIFLKPRAIYWSAWLKWSHDSLSKNCLNLFTFPHTVLSGWTHP